MKKFAACCAPLFALSLPRASAQPLTALDSTFATHGTLNVDSLRIMNVGRLHMALQPDGKIVTAGTYGYWMGGQYKMGTQLMRFSSTGRRDSSFGSAGALWLPGQSNAVTIGLQLMPDGRIVTGSGSGYFQGNHYTLYRLLPSGAPDPSFNDSGKVVYAPSAVQGQIDYNALAVQSDGGILLTGHWEQPTLFHYLNTFRHTASGAPDSSFGYYGRSSVGLFNTYDINGRVLAQQADGKFLVGGYAQDTPLWHNRNKSTLARCLPSGVLDTAFNAGLGFIKHATTGERGSEITSVVVRPTDGKILAAVVSQRRYDGPGVISVMQLTSSGALDPSFGTGGIAVVDSTGENMVSTAPPQLALQADGRVLISFASGMDTATQRFAVRRLTISGSPDGSFGASGKVTTRVSASLPGGASAITVQPNGRILAAGTSAHVMTGYTTLGIVRYHPYISFSAVPAAPDAASALALRIYPNPTTGDALHLEYMMPARGDVRIELRDLQGRTAVTFFKETRGAGLQSEWLFLPTSLARGTYVLCMRGAGHAASAVLVKQ